MIDDTRQSTIGRNKNMTKIGSLTITT